MLRRMTAISPFRIAVSDDVLEDLRSRLRRTRWPEAELVDDWSQGAPLQWIKDVCHYWAETYDWRQREARLNRFSQFTTEIDGLDIHFIHVEKRGRAVECPESRPARAPKTLTGSAVSSRSRDITAGNPDRRCRLTVFYQLVSV